SDPARMTSDRQKMDWARKGARTILLRLGSHGNSTPPLFSCGLSCGKPGCPEPGRGASSGAPPCGRLVDGGDEPLRLGGGGLFEPHRRSDVEFDGHGRPAAEVFGAGGPDLPGGSLGELRDGAAAI